MPLVAAFGINLAVGILHFVEVNLAAGILPFVAAVNLAVGILPFAAAFEVNLGVEILPFVAAVINPGMNPSVKPFHGCTRNNMPSMQPMMEVNSITVNVLLYNTFIMTAVIIM